MGVSQTILKDSKKRKEERGLKISFDPSGKPKVSFSDIMNIMPQHIRKIQDILFREWHIARVNVDKLKNKK